MDMEKMGYDSGLGEEGGSCDVCWAPPPSTAPSPEPLSDDSDPLFVPLNTGLQSSPPTEPVAWRPAPLEVIYENGFPPAPSKPSQDRIGLLSHNVISRSRRFKRIYRSGYTAKLRCKYDDIFLSHRLKKEQDITKPSLQDIAKKFSSLNV